MKVLIFICPLLLINFSSALRLKQIYDWKNGDTNTRNIQVGMNKEFSLKFNGNTVDG
jgi:hypothetical protein